MHAYVIEHEKNALKSDLRGIETRKVHDHRARAIVLKSDLRGIETGHGNH